MLHAMLHHARAQLAYMSQVYKAVLLQSLK